MLGSPVNACGRRGGGTVGEPCQGAMQSAAFILQLPAYVLLSLRGLSGLRGRMAINFVLAS